MHHVVHRVIASRSVLRTSMLMILVGAFLPHSALAQQAPANQSAPQVISCVSTKGQRQVCTADTAAGVALLRSTGESSCLLGKTWGYDDAGVWVFDGCGGEFALGSTGEASGASDFVGTFEPYGQLRTHLAALQRHRGGAGQRHPRRHQFQNPRHSQDVRRHRVGSESRSELDAVQPLRVGAWRLWRRRDRHQSSLHCTPWFCRHRFRTAGPGGHREAESRPLRRHQLHDRPIQCVWRSGNINLRGGY